MTILSSLRSRIFLASALLTVLAIGAAVYLVNVRVSEEAERTLQRELVSTAALVDQLRTTRTETFAQMARFIADAPKVKAAVDTNDPPTVQDIANGYQDQLKSNLLLVTNKNGEVLAMVGATSRSALVAASQPAVRGALTGHESFSLLPQPDGVLQFMTVPIAIGLTQPEILGTLSVGFLLDNAVAAQLKDVTGSDIAFGMNGQVLAATLPREDYAALADQFHATSASRISLGGQDYVALPRPLAAAGSPGDGRRRRPDPPVENRAVPVPAGHPTSGSASPRRWRLSWRRSSASSSHGPSRGPWQRLPTRCARWRRPATSRERS